MPRVQLRRSRAENYFLQTSLGLFSSKQKEHTVPGSKAGTGWSGKREIKWESREAGFRNIENVSFRARACMRCDKKEGGKEGEIYIFAPFIVPPERNPFFLPK